MGTGVMGRADPEKGGPGQLETALWGAGSGTRRGPCSQERSVGGGGVRGLGRGGGVVRWSDARLILRGALGLRVLLGLAAACPGQPGT